MKKITPGEIFNICDDVPSQSDVVVNYVANLMNIKIFKGLILIVQNLMKRPKVFI